MISQLTFNHRKSSFALEMKIFYVFINSVFGKQCCFDDWSHWQQSSLTCGQAPSICKHRIRNIVEGWGAVGAFFTGGLREEDCNEQNSCPWDETQYSSCENIDCRKFD